MAKSSSAFFEIVAPSQWTVPIVFNSPHSGSLLPEFFLAQSKLSKEEIRSSEDSHVDDLFSGCVAEGAPLIRALISRSFLDLNREPYEFDCRMFEEPLPSYMNTTSSRVACGLGTIPRIVGEGLNIYGGPITLLDAMNRVETVYRPYHRTLAALLDEAYRATGIILLVDCHSMPSTSVSKYTSRGKVDIVLGDRFGNSCDKFIVDVAESFLTAAGLTVARNKPYAGGFITETHGLPRHGRHALQIEINRALYMNETTRVAGPEYLQLKKILDGLAAAFATPLKQLEHEAIATLAAE